ASHPYAEENGDRAYDEAHAVVTQIKSWLESQTADEMDEATFEVGIKVIDADTGEGVRNALVAIEPLGTLGVDWPEAGCDTDEETCYGTTDSDGATTVNADFFASTEYVAHIYRDGYRRGRARNSFYSGITEIYSPNQFGTIELYEDEAGTGDLAGDVRSGITDELLTEVSCIVYSQTDIQIGSFTTGVLGTYSLTDLPLGRHRFVCEKDGYQTQSQYAAVIQDVETEVNLSLIPEGGDENSAIMRLTWDADPSDLDSHLIKYDADGEEVYHIYYADKTSGDDSLDLDDTTSYGPETVTVFDVDPDATYVYAIYHYSGDGTLTTTSEAMVQVNLGGGLYQYNVPSDGTSGRWWKVLELVDGYILPCNDDCILDSEPTPTTSKHSSNPQWLQDMQRDLIAKEDLD
ncbi:MAG: carboxypeptidase regulatory-like domain-containing protein, partial [Magnetococcales bacterium]|nr:carboxypeptidase regulatory-like domain-containing protein [Magnetococcales bacterium]